MADPTPVHEVRPIGFGELAGVDDLVRDPQQRRRPGVVGRLVRLVVLVLVVALGYYGVSLFQVWSTGRADQQAAVDAIVVMGAAQYDGTPSRQLQARLDHAAALYAAGRAPLVVVTGGKQPGDRFTEAEASARYLREPASGVPSVPESALLLENEGRNSYESLVGVQRLLAERGLSRVLIVTDPYHALRSRLIAQDVGLVAYVSSTTTSVVTGTKNLRRHLLEAGGVAAGRVIGFDSLP